MEQTALVLPGCCSDKAELEWLADWFQLAHPSHLPPHLRAPQGQLPAELTEYGKRIRAVEDLRWQIYFLRKDELKLKTEGTLFRAGEATGCLVLPADAHMLPSGVGAKCSKLRRACR